MLKTYIVASLVTTGLMILGEIRTKTNKNVKTYISKNIPKENKKWYKRLFSHIKSLLFCWIPIANIIYAGISIFALFASDYMLVKLLKSVKEQDDTEKKELEKIINN